MKFNISIFALYIVNILAFSPIAVPLVSVESKSIDVVFIDLFLIISVIFLMLSKKILVFEQLVLFSSL